MLKNSPSRYGLVSISMHWLTAITIYGLFGLGLYMTDLTYYDAWYNKGPDVHRSIGILLFIVMVARWLWKITNARPEPEPNLKRWEIKLSSWTHSALYLLVFLAIVTGYLISTAKGSSVAVFDWFKVPALFNEVRGMEDIAGKFHYYLSWALVLLSALHVLASIKHHLIDGDNTLIRMLGGKERNKK